MINLFKAYKAGALARKKGVVVGDNPYDEHLAEYWEWMRGWIDGPTVITQGKRRIETMGNVTVTLSRKETA